MKNLTIVTHSRRGQKIFTISVKSLYEKGRRFTLFLPSLVTLVIEYVKLLPLWSAVQIPVFNYGDETANLVASVKWNFKKLKIVTLPGKILPTDIERFSDQHISFLEGESLVHSIRCDQQSSQK